VRFLKRHGLDGGTYKPRTSVLIHREFEYGVCRPVSRGGAKVTPAQDHPTDISQTDIQYAASTGPKEGGPHERKRT